MIFRNTHLFELTETDIVGKETQRLLVLFHDNHINLSQCISGFQGHNIVDGLSQEDLLFVVVALLFNFVGTLKVGGHVAGINLVFGGADGTFDGLAHVEPEGEGGARSGAEFGGNFWSPVDGIDVCCSSHFADYLDSSDETHVCKFGSIF